MSNLIKTAFIAQFGFSPSRIYCQFTGKPLGVLDESEFAALVDSVGGNAGDADFESICDDIHVRLLASMRPSMRWNVMRVETINDMRKSVPHETLAYLLNQLLAAPNERVASFASRLGDLSERITYWDTIQTLSDEQIDLLLYMLIDWDVKWGLTAESPPLTRADLFNGDPVENLKAHYHRRIDEWAVREKQIEAQARWVASGGSRSRSARVEMFFENDKPHRTTLIRDMAKQETKRARAVANVAKKQEQAQYDSWLEEVLESSGKPATPPAPIKSAPKLRLGKLAIARKG